MKKNASIFNEILLSGYESHIRKVLKKGKKKRNKAKEEFPHSWFPYKIRYKDHDGMKTCYFQSELYMNKHIERYNLNRKEITISSKYDFME